MSESKGKGKVEIKIGNLAFSAEGDQEWLAEQLMKVIEAAAPNAAVAPPAATEPENPSDKKGSANAGSLASYVKAKGGDSKQVQRFLATAAWLHHRGVEKLTAGAVAKALADNHQNRVANPADCLNKNCSKGYAEKTKDGFFITPEGWKALGEAE